MDMNVNKTKIPLYYQIYDYFKNKIRTEELKEGEGLPPERDLAKIFEVSRETIRQALKKLEEENYIYRIHGNGTFVSNKIIQQDLTNFYSFYEETVKTGKIPSSKVLGYDIINADEEMIEISINKDVKIFLNITPSVKIGIYITRKYENQIPLKKGTYVMN